MSTCTASEIAEKRRIALEKLQAKKNKTESAKQPINKLTQNGSANFYNALKNNLSFRDRPKCDTAHPYKRDKVEKISQIAGQNDTSKEQYGGILTSVVHCRLQLITPTRFKAVLSGYHDKLIEVFKRMPSKNYNVKTRVWDFALTDYNTLQVKINDLKPSVVISAIPREVIDLCIEPQKEPDYSCLVSIEPTLVSKLMPFQRSGVCFAIAHNGRLMICDEMGLGKTYQAIAVADYYKDEWPLLICTTASTRNSWANHIRTLLPGIPLHYIQIMTGQESYVGEARVLITSYSMMERHEGLLADCKFGFLIFDESQSLKNKKAKCTEVATRLASKCKHILLLSGTPALSRPLELFTQLKLIDKNFMNFTNYTTRYCDGKATRFGWDATGQSNLEELNVLLKLRYMIRRTKDDVLPDLAEKSRETVILNPELIIKDDDFEAKLNALNAECTKSRARPDNKKLLEYYSYTAKIKTRAVCAYLKTVIKEPIKCIIFAYHHFMLDAICDCLYAQKARYMRIDGSTPSNIRAEYIETFQNDPSCKIGVLSLTACNSGITLTAAEIIIFAELHWNPSTLTQAESRAHRIGQEKPVICRYLIANKTADDILWNMLKMKQDVLNKAGLFCEDLQDSEYNLAPCSSKKIDLYFTPTKPNPKSALAEIEAINEPKIAKNENSIELNTNTKRLETAEATKLNLEKELENIDQFFNDDGVDENVEHQQELQNIQEFFDDNDDFSFEPKPIQQHTKNELENIEQFFAEDDDDAFRNLEF